MSLGRESYILPLQTTKSDPCVASTPMRFSGPTPRPIRCAIGVLACHRMVEGG